MPLRIIVVGAGIGGPALAIGLARNEHKVTIYERSTISDAIGYAFRITPNSDRCLKYFGIDTVAGGASAANSMQMFDTKGNLIFQRRENADPEKAKQATSVFAFRPQLHKQLIDKAIESGVKLETGIKVVGVDTEKTAIELEGGKRIEADLIVAADGVHSVVRPHIVDTKKFTPGPTTGRSAFRFMLSKETLKNDDLLGPLIRDDMKMFSWASLEKRILAYPVDFDKQFNFTLTHPDKLSNDAAKGDDAAAIAYNQTVPFETVLDIYSEFEPRVRRLLELADPNGFRVWKLVDADEIPRWSVHQTTPLGDACHPVNPFGFSGASMAIEDAATLSVLLPAEVQPSQVQERLALYERIRKPRVGRVRGTARVIATQLKPPEGYFEFLAEHDAMQTAREALANQADIAS